MKLQALLPNGRLSILTIFFAIIIALTVSCKANEQSSPKKIQFNGLAQSTSYSIIYFDSLGRNFQPEIELLFKNFNLTASLWDSNSVINQVNNNVTQNANVMFLDILKKSIMIAELTNGAFDYTVGPLVALYGFGNKEGKNRIITTQEINELLPCVGYNKVKIEGSKVIKENPCTQIDFNAIAKGYSVDLIATFLRKKGIYTYLIEVGGEISAKGVKPGNIPWVVGIEKPSQSPNAQSVILKKIAFTDKCLATSGNYRKFYNVGGTKYAHTIEPKTGKSIQSNLLSATIIADACWEADGLATACMVMGIEKAKAFILSHPSYEALFIYVDENEQLQTWVSNNLKNMLLDEK